MCTSNGLFAAINVYLLKIDESMPSLTINSDMSDAAKWAELKIQVLL
jgi:hypothetical protein